MIIGGDWYRPDELRCEWRVQDDGWPGKSSIEKI